MDNLSNIATVYRNETVKSGMCEETNSFRWEIENFNAVRKSRKQIERQKFTFTAGASVNFRTEWEIRLVLSKARRTGAEEEQMWIGSFLYLKKAPVSSSEVFASWQFEIKSTRQESSIFRRTKVHDHNVTIGWGYTCIFLQNQESNDFPLINGSLVVELTVRLYAAQPKLLLMEIFEDAFFIEEQYRTKFQDKLQKDYAKLLICPPESSNVTKIVAMDETEFTVTSCLLFARSPAFRRMFDSEMTEDTTGIVRIDISSKTMFVLLSFLYAGKLQPNWRHPDVITELVYAAGKFQLPDLLEFLDEVVGTLCTKENAGELMNLAKKLSLKKAENDLWEFVKKNVTSLDEMIAFTKDADRVVDNASVT